MHLLAYQRIDGMQGVQPEINEVLVAIAAGLVRAGGKDGLPRRVKGK
jgi:hypothetical protein